MSADAWRVCPKCKKKHEKRVIEDHKSIEALYGKVPAKEYERKKREILVRLKDEEPGETLREDYEIHMNEEGQFTVDYGAMCTQGRCDFRFSYKHEEETI